MIKIYTKIKGFIKETPFYTWGLIFCGLVLILYFISIV